MKSSKKAIALLITAMFVIVITVAIGYTLKQINEASRYVEQENSMYQNFIFVEDVLNILKNSAELQELTTEEDLFIFLSTSGFVTFEHSGVRLVLNISSARRGFAINSMTKEQEGYLYELLMMNNIRGEYVDILKDSIAGIKEDNYYRTALFDKEPALFRDYIASTKHLRKLNRFYQNEYRDDSLENIDLESLFYLSSNDANISIDLNYATPEVWQLIIGVDKERSKVLASGENIYTSLDSLRLTEEQKKRIAKFNYSFFEPFLNIKMDIIKDNLISHISFEYDIKNKKGYNFVYEL